MYNIFFLFLVTTSLSASDSIKIITSLNETPAKKMLQLPALIENVDLLSYKPSPIDCKAKRIIITEKSPEPRSFYRYLYGISNYILRMYYRPEQIKTAISNYNRFLKNHSRFIHFSLGYENLSILQQWDQSDFADFNNSEMRLKIYKKLIDNKIFNPQPNTPYYCGGCRPKFFLQLYRHHLEHLIEIPRYQIKLLENTPDMTLCKDDLIARYTFHVDSKEIDFAALYNVITQNKTTYLQFFKALPLENVKKWVQAIPTFPEYKIEQNIKSLTTLTLPGLNYHKKELIGALACWAIIKGATISEDDAYLFLRWSNLGSSFKNKYKQWKNLRHWEFIPLALRASVYHREVMIKNSDLWQSLEPKLLNEVNESITKNGPTVKKLFVEYQARYADTKKLINDVPDIYNYIAPQIEPIHPIETMPLLDYKKHLANGKQLYNLIISEIQNDPHLLKLFENNRLLT